MSRYTAEIIWEDIEDTFKTGKYSRAHKWRFDGGIEVEASSSPNVVRLPFSKEAAVDPEEAYVASISCCHMLTFLFVAYQEKYVVSRYYDKALGIMEKNEKGQEWISTIELSPEITFEGKVPNGDELARLHAKAHHDCYIANSVKTEIKVNQPRK